MTRAHAGAQHLDHHFAAVAQARRVHLRDRGGRQRLLVEAARTVRSSGRPKLRSMAGARQRAGKRRHLVLQLRQLVGDVGRQQVAARGQRLAELHEDRPQLLAAPGAGARRASSPRRRWNQVQGERKNRKRSGRYRCVARTKSSSPCRTSTRWISISRPSTRSFIASAARDAARRAALLEAARRARRRVGCSRSARRRAEVLGLGARHEVAALVREVVGDVAQHGRAAPRGPSARSACAARAQPGAPARARAAAAKLLLEVRAQQRAQLAGTAAPARSRRRCCTSPRCDHAAAIGAGQRQQCQRAAADVTRRRRLGAACASARPQPPAVRPSADGCPAECRAAAIAQAAARELGAQLAARAASRPGRVPRQQR